MCEKILPDSIALPVVTLWSPRDVQIHTTCKIDVKSLIGINSQIKVMNFDPGFNVSYTVCYKKYYISSVSPRDTKKLNNTLGFKKKKSFNM